MTKEHHDQGASENPEISETETAKATAKVTLKEPPINPFLYFLPSWNQSV